MRFIQSAKDGSCRIIFSEQEKKIIKEKGEFFLDAMSFRHFTNNLIRAVSEFHKRFPEEVKQKQTKDDDLCEGKECP
jgi:hypothetical protein